MKATVLLKLVQIKCIFFTSSYIIFLFDVILNLFVPFFYPLLVISCEGHLILTAFTMSWEKTEGNFKKNSCEGGYRFLVGIHHQGKLQKGIACQK